MTDTNGRQLDTPHAGDTRWARAQPISVVPSKARLDAPHQLVTIKNTSPNQTHIVVDRFMVGHELLPGRSQADVDMTAADIEYYLRQRRPDRTTTVAGIVRQLPLHPVVIEGLTEDPQPQPREEISARHSDTEQPRRRAR
jgi:hypothetical protein